MSAEIIIYIKQTIIAIVIYVNIIKRLYIKLYHFEIK